MTRLAELQNKYPSIHKEIIFRWELMVHGIRDSIDLDKASVWRPASQGAYLNHDEELTLERLRKETPWRVRDDAVLVPVEAWTKTGLSFPLYRKDRSPYVMRETSGGKLAVFDGDELVDVEILVAEPQKERQKRDLVTSRGTPVRDLVEQRTGGACYCVVPMRFCEYFNTGDDCKFCNYNPTQVDAKSAGLNRSVTINPDDTAEAFKILGSESKLVEGFLVGGGFAKSEKEASVNTKFVEKMNSALSYKTDMKLCTGAMTRPQLQRLKDAGLTGIKLHMEAFDERFFAYVSPGKARNSSREAWLESCENAVEVFGVGNVGAKFVAGVTMLGPFGHSTWQEARDSHIEGDRWMISRGIFPSMGALRWAPGSQFSKDLANREKFPPTEFYLELMLASHAAMKEYGLYERLNRFLYCGLCYTRHVYCGEMGMLEIGGDVGAWMSSVVPYDRNWIARVIDSMKSSA